MTHINSDIEKLKNIIYEEGNFYEWRDKYSGYICRIIRPISDGWLCGYVSVPEGHNCFGKGYDDVNVEVHGGLTYSRDMGVKGNWWLGFDCVHAGDLNPRDVLVYGYKSYHDDDTYRTVHYVKNECKELAKQLKDMEGC